MATENKASEKSKNVCGIYLKHFLKCIREKLLFLHNHGQGRISVLRAKSLMFKRLTKPFNIALRELSLNSS